MKRVCILLLCALFVNVGFCQYWYGKVGFGSEITTKDLNHYNNTMNVQVGYLFENNSGMEFDYSYGFEKHLVSYNRIGVNFVYEFEHEYESYCFPYLKFGAAYKSYNYERYKDEYGDFKLGFGVNGYVTSLVAISFGLDCTLSVNDDIGFDLGNTILHPYIALQLCF